MPYIGYNVTNAGSFALIDDIASTFNGSNTAFTLQVGGVNITPNVQNLLIAIDGVVQQAPDAYSVSGSTITFTGAPASGADFYGVLMGQSSYVENNSITADELAVSGDGSSGQLLSSDGDGTFSWLSSSSITSVGTLTSLTTSGTITVGASNGSTEVKVNRSRMRHIDGLADASDYSHGDLYVNHISTGNIYMQRATTFANNVTVDGDRYMLTEGGTNKGFFGKDDWATSGGSANDVNVGSYSGVVKITAGAGSSSTPNVTFNTGKSTIFSGQVNFGTTDSYIKQSNFGYSSSYHVLQLGEASSTRAISIGADLTGNSSGGFTGNEIVIPNARGILAPNGANNAYLGVLGVTSSNTIEIGRGNHSIVTAGNGAISIDTSTNHVSIAGGQSTYSSLGVHTVGTNTYSETGNTHHTDSAITIDFPNSDQSFGAIRWRSHGNMENFFGVVQQGSSGQGDWVWQCFDGSAYDERMRLSEEGLLSIKYGIDSYGLYINGLPSSSTKGILLACGSSSATVDAILFRDGSADNCGNITLNSQANTTNYGASSDYRLKENEEIISDGIERIKKLKPYRFNFITAPDQTMDGFFAHELAEHIPEAVSGEKDAMDGDEIKPQNVDYGKVTPLLVKAVQELIAKVEALENA